MDNDEVLTPAQVDTQIAVFALKERSSLWRAAEGRMTWRSALGLLTAVILVVIGVVQIYQDGAPPQLSHEYIGITFLLVGVVNLALSIWGVQQSRLDAILEIVRRQERIGS